ncbi:DUF6179 domain-containing protein [Anaeromassilibacillus senegalensis]|uniref:DUF6179 domain-containing protein n=1 Tax=Anaeromassilibacillus senegalensis TaxID=1673717 RepID=UPI0006820120|nr:DUF6179 domain-containing protein [Anaeromassilibacillus senegalensis]
MNHQLEAQSVLKGEHLNRAQYLQSLLSAAYRAHLLSDAEMERMQLELVALLAEQTQRFTHGESSSLPVETAQSLLQSVYYGVGEYLKTLPDAASALRQLQKEPLHTLFQRGKACLLKRVEELKDLYRQVLETRLPTESRAYNDTIDGIQPFFSTYDLEFTGHETPGAMIDYPLCMEVQGETGCSFLRRYLYHLLQENRFLQRFAPERIDTLLRAYDQSYPELLFNLFEHVLIHALACVLCRKDPALLCLTSGDRESLRAQFTGKTLEEIRPVLTGAVEQLQIPDGTLARYVRESASQLAAKLRLALDHNALESFFVVPMEATEKVIQFMDGERMPDEVFRAFIDEVSACRDLSDKIRRVRERVHSMQDLTDTLAGGCLFGPEYVALFAVLEEIELALLWNQLPQVENDLHRTRGDEEWQQAFSVWLQQQPEARRARILALAAHISLPEDE